MARISTFVDEAAEARYRSVYDDALAVLPDHERVDTDTEFGTVRALTFGDGDATPVVLLHGMSCTSAMWAPNIAALAAGRRVIALDAIADCGGSRQTAPISGRGDVVVSIVQSLAELGVERAHFVGLSYGAWAAAGCAVEAPELVASLSLLEPAATLHPIKAAYVLGLLASFVRRSPRRWDFLFHRRPFDELIALLDASRGFRPAGPLPHSLKDDELAAIVAPTQVILGSHSTTCDEARTRKRLATLPHVPVHVVEHAGHIVSVDQPEAVNRLLAAFIAKR